MKKQNQIKFYTDRRQTKEEKVRAMAIFHLLKSAGIAGDWREGLSLAALPVLQVNLEGFGRWNAESITISDHVQFWSSIWSTASGRLVSDDRDNYGNLTLRVIVR